MDPFRPLYDMVTPFVPLQYSILAQQWGLYSYWGPIVAFIAAVLLLFGLFYLGSLIAFGRLIEENENTKRTLILISTTMSLIGAWYGAGIMLQIMSNLIFLFGTVMVVILLASITRALLKGVTVEEAKIDKTFLAILIAIFSVFFLLFFNLFIALILFVVFIIVYFILTHKFNH